VVSIFFFQAEDGIRGFHVTGVQTCALPIYDFNEVLKTDMNLVLLSDMLVKVDMMSMANSLEVRSPFLDYKVVDFAFGLPATYKRSEEHTSVLQSRENLVCRLLLSKKKPAET